MIKVPLHYSPREKFIEFIEVKSDYDSVLDTDTVLPRFGFEMLTIDYDSARMMNPLNKIRSIDDTNNAYMLNRIPYNFQFQLYLGARKFEDSLKIIEQIVPFFTPDLNISIKDKADFGLVTDIPIVLNNVAYEINYQGGFENRRTIMWTLNFIVKAWLYSNVRAQNRIKETIVQMTDLDFDKVYATLISEVVPRDADKTDPHEVVDTVTDGDPPARFSIDFNSGGTGQIGAASGTPATVLHFDKGNSGQAAEVQKIYSGNPPLFNFNHIPTGETGDASVQANQNFSPEAHNGEEGTLNDID